MEENVRYAGWLTSTLRGPDGKIKQQRHTRNVVTNLGLDWLVKHTMDTSATCMTVFYIGSTASGGAAAAADTTGETDENYRLAFTYVTGGTNGRCSATATFGASGTAGDSTTGITEAGIFNGAVATSGDGVLFCRAIFSAINKGVNDTLEIKWDIVYS